MKTMTFTSAGDFRRWLVINHRSSEGIFVRIYKKASRIPTVTYDEALDQALCFGWIDGQKQPFDAESWLQKFTPRRPRSKWSKKNTRHAQRLIECGAMTAAGVKEMEAAKSDGRWEAAYDSFSTAVVPPDFLEALNVNKKAKAFFETLDKSNVYSITYRLQTAKKPETRERRMRLIIEKLARHEPLR